MADLKNIVLPEFSRPKTKEAAYELAERLTGDYWPQFSPPRPAAGAPLGALGGQAFLAKRVKGPEWRITQPLCWLCGQGVLTTSELIMALGRRTVMHSTGWEEKVSGGRVQAKENLTLVDKVSAYGFDLWPTDNYRKLTGIRPYDQKCPDPSPTPYIYVIEDQLGDVKVGISTEPAWRFRCLERDENTTLVSWYCTKSTRYALTIEQTVLNHFGKGRNKRKKSEEWLWEVTFDEAKAAVERELTKY